MRPSIIVHGGAGVHDAARLPRCVAGCEAAARAGWSVLDGGGSALDAVEAAVRVLEEDPEFNAGRGAVLNRDGRIEVDAAIMDDALHAGAVGALPFVLHPVTVARRLLVEGVHVLLVGEGALAYAREQGIEPEAPEAMIVERARMRWERERAGLLQPSGTGDTVGAVAMDATGRAGAASSTGGTSSKRPGRVGDSPLVGGGLYALEGCAATATGHGESLLKVTISRLTVDALRAGAAPEDAARAAIEEMARRTGGDGGVIAVDARGRVGAFRNSARMPWAAVVGGAVSSGD